VNDNQALIPTLQGLIIFFLRRIKKKLTLRFSLLILVLIVGACKPAPKQDVGKKAQSAKPNILFILTDDQRSNAINALGNKELNTPHLDKLVRNGTSFTNAYILGAATAAVCSPSRAMLMTGRHYFNIEPSVYAQFAFPPEERGKSSLLTFPAYFKANGYTTFTTGKQHNGRDWVEQGFDQVKSAFLGGMTTHFGTKVKDYTPEAGWSAPYQQKEKFSSEVFADAALSFLEKKQDNSPFLMYVSFTAPHDPRTAPPAFHDDYPVGEIDLPQNFMPEHPFEIADDRIRDEVLAPFPRTKQMIQKEIADYYAMISATDAQIGRILQALEASGQAENTLVIMAADNGLAVGQHGLLGKQNVYEHSIGIPLIFSGPNIPKGKKVDALAYLHDVFPTLCGLTNLEIPASIETKDLSPVIKGEKTSVRNSMHFAYQSWPGDLLKKEQKSNPGGGHRAIRKGNYKLIVSSKNAVFTYQLFDLENDPWELSNLYNDQNFTSIKTDLLNELQQLISQTGDPAQLDKDEFGLFDNPEAYNFK